MGLLTTRRSRDPLNWDAPWDLQRELNRFFNSPDEAPGPVEAQFTPATDVRETDDAYIVEVDLPGMKKEDVHIEVADDVLTISGERNNEREETTKDLNRIERRYGSFRRSLSIPGGFDQGNVEADFADGVLTVSLPKPEETKPTRIDIKAN